MHSSSKTLVYLSFGAAKFLEESLFSLLKGLDCCGGEMPPTIVFTDQPEKFSQVLGSPAWLDLRLLTPESRQAFRRPGRTGKAEAYRIKMCLMIKLLEEGVETAVMVDGDTYYLQSPWALFEGIGPQAARMHMLEGRLNDGRMSWENLRNGAREYNRSSPLAKEFPVPVDQAVYNSGVIGLHQAHLPLIRQALEVFDGLVDAGIDERIYEQFAISVVLAPRTAVLASDEILAHYWYDRPGVGRAVRRLFGEPGPRTVEDWVAGARRIQPGTWWRTRIVHTILSWKMLGMTVSPRA